MATKKKTAAVPPPEPEPPAMGIRCRDCGCADFIVLYTQRVRGERIFRRRECRHCGRRMTTSERVVG